MWFLLGLAGLALPGLLYVLGRRSERATLNDWESAIGPRGTLCLEATRLRTNAQLALLDWMFEQAREAEASGRPGQALRLLDLGCSLIEDYCPGWSRSLAAMAVLARMVTAIEPLAPVGPRPFKTRELKQLAQMGEFIHHFLVSTRERFQLRTAILRSGFRTLMRIAFRSRADASWTGPEWKAFDDVRADARTLSGESVETARVLLAALEAGPRR